jgi:subtilisin-like proprotein convertase family protein
MIKTVFEQGTRIGRVARLPNLRRLILLSVLFVLASLAVSASASAETLLFSNPTPIAIPGSGDIGNASPYPSEIAVSGMSGPITNVAVTLHRFGHNVPVDADILLVSPSGDTVIMMSDACGTGPQPTEIEDFTWTFSQQAAGPMTAPCDGFAYQPTNNGSVNQIFSGAPAGPHGTSFNDFNNENPNGTWKLYVVDDFDQSITGHPRDIGDIEGGWSLTISTGPVDVAIPASGTSGTASPYPVTRTVSGQAGGITDLNVTIDGIWHERPDDLDLLLVGPRGQKVVLMSDACGPLSVNSYGWVWDDEAAAPMPEGNGADVCGTRFHKPANYGSGDLWPAPAPAGPYSSSLSAFDFTNPNGEWRLFVQDDAATNTGFFTNRFQLGITTDATAPTVTSVSPASNATGVGLAANVSATFSEAMRAASITTNTLTLYKAGTTTKVGAVVSYDAAAKSALLNPNANLQRGVKYKAVVTTGARDLAGNQLDQNTSVVGNQQKVWFFTTRN